MSTAADPLALLGDLGDLLNPAEGHGLLTPADRAELRRYGATPEGEAWACEAIVGADPAERVRAAVATPIALASVLWIDGPDGPEPWVLWDCQVEALRVCLRYRKVSILKARQLGITWTVCSLLGLWDACSYTAGEDLVVSNTLDDAQDVIRRARRLYHSAPPWFHDAFPLATDTASELGIRHPGGISALISLSSSANAGRGRTFRRVMADERARWKRSIGAAAARQRMTSLRPTVADSGSLVELSTADGYDGHFDTWSGGVDPGEPVAGGNGYVRLFCGALEHPKRDEEWVRREREILDRDEEGTGAQEYPLSPEEAWLASGRCAFDRASLIYLERVSAEPAPWRGALRDDDFGIHAESAERGDWWVWEWPRRGRDYGVFADACGGHGGDYAAATVIDLASWDQVAAFHGKVEPAVLAAELWKAGWLWRGVERPALLVPESNNHGAGVLALLREWLYPRLYRVERLDKEGKPEAHEYGWYTSDKSRHLAISALQRGLRDRTLGIRDRAALVEMHRFVWVVVNDATGSGRYQADEGSNDDRVASWWIAAAVLAHSRSAAPEPEEPAPVLPYTPRVSSVTGY